MDQREGPTVYDINKPGNVGATASARPVITGHQPTMPDPMVNPPKDADLDGDKISVKVNDKSGIDADRLAGSLFPGSKPNEPAVAIKESGDGPPLMEGEPLQSPPFKPEGDSRSAAQSAPYMPVSALTGIDTQTAGPKSTSVVDDVKLTTEPKPAVFGSESNPDDQPKPPKHRRGSGKVWLTLLATLVVLAGLYAAIDKGWVLDSVNLPFHIFSQNEAKTDTATTSQEKAATTAPSGFTGTKLVEANLSFAYPTEWGAPTAATDQGFSKRSANAKADVNYAFLVSFPNNKDVEVVVTSGKYLPPARATQYYDFLGWCTGTADGKYYAGALRFTTDSDKNDTPTTITCDQGPLNNVVKLNSDTIVQTNIKNIDASQLGDVYTKNLSDKAYVVVRVKDATMKNGDQIKQLLDTIKPL